ncbi:unnamed protein product [Meloidogyne enterolobii]|uniref:Uncharacterized protein n=1 Tax=Meloidogyne enterolobii TaxID=390850 RepID=A0ACB0YHP6_MELEN
MNRSGVSLNSEQKMKLIGWVFLDFLFKFSNLLEAIHERPQIWDSSYEGFRSNPTRQGAFNEVAELLSEGGTEIFTRIQVQEEWGKLRYCFTRIVKKLYDEGYISPNGTVLQLNPDHQLITWPYWQPMNFLLEGVALQLCSTRGGGGGGSNYGGDDGVGDVNNKGNTRQNSEEPDNHKIRRSRKGMRGGLSSAITHKHNKSTNSYLAIEEDLSSLSNPKTQSTNDLLMSNLLSSFAPQDLLLSNFNALNEQFHPQKMEDDIETIIVDTDLNKKSKEENEELKNVEIEQQNKRQQNIRGEENNEDVVVTNENLKGKRKRRKDDIYGSKERYLVKIVKGHPLGAEKSYTSKTEMTRADSLSGLDLLLRQRIEVTNGQITTNGHENHNHQQPQRQQQRSSYSPAPLEPSNTTKTKLLNTNSLSGSEGSGGGVTICGTNSVCGGGGGTIDDVNESFGRCIVHQLQMVAKKDALLCVQMRKKLLEVCFEYEMQACKISKTDD